MFKMSNAKYAFPLLSSIHVGLMLSMRGYVFQTISQYPLVRFNVSWINDQSHGHLISMLVSTKLTNWLLV